MYHNTEVSAYLKAGSDTLEVFPGKQIKFIKVGDRVYRIESPRLTEVVSDSPVWIDRNGGVGKIQLLTDPYRTTLEWRVIDTSWFKRKP